MTRSREAATILKPRTIRVDASTICQLKCPVCPNAQRLYEQVVVGYGYLRESDFRSLLDDNPWISEIELANSGEVFLNPDLLGIMEYAHRKDVILTINSGANLNTVRPEVLDGLVRYRVRSVACALDGTCNETYTKYRVNGDFDTVLENVKTIIDLKKRYGSKYPLLRWQFIVFGHNEHEIPVARRMAEELGMEFDPRFNCDPGFSPIRDEPLVRREIGAAGVEEFRRVKGDNYGHAVCYQLWDAPQVNWDGTMLGCCLNISTDFGNVFREGLLTVLNSEKMTRAREMLTGVCGPSPDLWCSSCPQYEYRRSRDWWISRGSYHRAMRYCYENIRLPYSVKLSAYRVLKGPYGLPPIF
ncbi:MAG: SPASM domain-containing protein [Actinomycetota bacterium]